MTKAIIAGGGIGGLAAAIALRAAGMEVVVLERASEHREIGAAVVLWPNGTRALQSLGVEPVWLEVRRLKLMSSDGRLLTEPPVAALADRYGSGMMVVHRAELHSALLVAFGRDAVRLAAEVSGFQDTGFGVQVRLADGGQEEADLLIGADGLRSAVRGLLVGDGLPVYRGFTAWRGEIQPGEVDVEPGSGRNWWGVGGEFLAFTLTDGRLYWAGTANAPAGAGPGAGGHKQDVLERFAGWQPEILTMVRATAPDAILRTDIHDRPSLSRWSKGRVTLLGDAAHPMTPSQGQGACQALEDAVALGRSMGRSRSLSEGLASYERARVKRANRVVTLSRQTSRSIQSDNRLLLRARSLAIRLLPVSVLLRVLDVTLATPS